MNKQYVLIKNDLMWLQKRILEIENYINHIQSNITNYDNGHMKSETLIDNLKYYIEPISSNIKCLKRDYVGKVEDD